MYIYIWSGAAAYFYNSSYSGGGGDQEDCYPRPAQAKVSKTPSQQISSAVVHTCNARYVEAQVGRKAWQKARPSLKNNL
jgi:hypothetical protein